MRRKKTEENILDVLNSLQKGQQLVITWIDASETKGINLHAPALPNKAVETRKETPGFLVCVQKGDAYHDLHLIIGVEKTDELWHINSIPICLIKSVRISEIKSSLSTMKQYTSKKSRKKVLKILGGGAKYLW